MPKIYYTSEGYKIEVAKVTLNNYKEVGKWLEGINTDVTLTEHIDSNNNVTNLKLENSEGIIIVIDGLPIYIFRNLDLPMMPKNKCHLVTSETFAKMDLRKSHYLLQLFAYKHLPPHLQEVSKPICELAEHLDKTLPSNVEKTSALRKLREANDCAVTAVLFK